ncbi:DinB family protein [Paucisalibacillus globulus]|uniref:DinB family protein n=1 Tax=Paucisalibacillus globulus TaxID=351095 RepID=UPI00042883FF|nr:DinB family protein [Paucisalibacillus globulus]
MSSIITKSFEETREELVELVRGLSDEAFNAKPSEDRWSIGQIYHHLALVELATVKAVQWGVKEDKDTKTEQKNISPMLNRKKKFPAPKVVEPGGGPFEVKEIVEMLNNSRKKLLATVNSLEDSSSLYEKSVVHPAFGLLPLNQWVEAVPLHEQRHMEQIKEIMGNNTSMLLKE